MRNESHTLAKRQNYNELLCYLLISAALVLLLPPSAVAAELAKRFSLTSSVEHDTNPAQAEDDRDPVWLYTLIPQINLGLGDDVNSWYLESALLLQRPSNEAVYFDRQDPRLLLGWDREYQAGSYGVRVGYEQSAGRVLQLQSTGVIANLDSTQRTRYINAKWQHDFSARWTILNQVNYTKTKFDELLITSGPDAVLNFDVSEVKSRLGFANTEKLNTYAELGYLQFMPDGFRDDTDLSRLQFGADYLVREGFALGVNAGLYSMRGQQSDSGWEAGVLAKYTLDRMAYSASLSRSLGAGGLLGFQQTDSLQGTWEFNVSELNLVGASFIYSKSKEDNSANLEAIDFKQVNAFYQRILSNHWSARFAASYRTFDVEDLQKSNGSLIGVTLTYDTSGFLVR